MKSEGVSEGSCTAVKRVCLRRSSENSTVEDRPAGGTSVQVSVIVPVYNGSDWLDQCLQAVVDQDYQGSMELSVYDDSSTDNSRVIVEGWRDKLEERGISLVISGHKSETPKGVGFAKNQAVSQSCGQYLCFQDAQIKNLWNIIKRKMDDHKPSNHQTELLEFLHQE